MSGSAIKRDERRLRDAASAFLAGSPGVVRVVDETPSTQDLARDLAREGLPAIVLARHQTAGRGRLGRTWNDAPGMGVACSIALPREALDLEELPARVGVAACAAIESFRPRAAPALKWPNDIVTHDADSLAGGSGLRKLAGVLIESRDDLAVIGVGVNVRQHAGDFPPEIARSSTSLAMLGVDAQPIDVCDALLRALAPALDSHWSEILEAWRARDALVGRAVRLRLGARTLEGLVESVEPARGISLRTSDGSIVHADARVAQLDAILD